MLIIIKIIYSNFINLILIRLFFIYQIKIKQFFINLQFNIPIKANLFHFLIFK